MKRIEEEKLVNYRGGNTVSCISGIAGGGLLGIRIGGWFGPWGGVIGGLVGAAAGAWASC